MSDHCVDTLTLDHVQVAAPAGCETPARAFYGDLLGLRELVKPPALAARGGVWFAVGDRALHVGVDEPFRAARTAAPALPASPADGAVPPVPQGAPGAARVVGGRAARPGRRAGGRRPRRPLGRRARGRRALL